jgi:hypothetical protein
MFSIIAIIALPISKPGNGIRLTKPTQIRLNARTKKIVLRLVSFGKRINPPDLFTTSGLNI